MVRQDFIQLAESQILAGFSRGIDLFTEELNNEIERDEVLKEHSLNEVVECLVDDYGTRHPQIYKK